MLGSYALKLGINNNTVLFNILTSSTLYLIYLLNLLTFNKSLEQSSLDKVTYVIFFSLFSIITLIIFYISHLDLYNFFICHLDIDINNKYFVCSFISIYTWVLSTSLYSIIKIFLNIVVNKHHSSSNYYDLFTLVRNNFVYDLEYIKNNKEVIINDELCKTRFNMAKVTYNHLNDYLDKKRLYKDVTDKEFNEKIEDIEEAIDALNFLNKYIDERKNNL